MIFNVTKDTVLLAALKIENGAISLEGVTDDDLRKEIQRMVSDGVIADRDVYDAKTETYIMVQENVQPNHPYFVLALKQHLQRLGYEVEESHQELQEEIQLLLKKFPDTDEKRVIISKLPTMSHLELTSAQKMIVQFLEQEKKA